MSEPTPGVTPAREIEEESTGTWDIVIIGAGLGGSALAWSLRKSGLKILVLERGEHIPQEPENWDPDEVISGGRYEPDETWVDESGRSFSPRVYYNVGGSSKFFGGSAFRLRRRDFAVKRWTEGDTPAWPITYDDLAPWYRIAEKQMMVHGERGTDPTDPTDTDSAAADTDLPEPYPYPPLEDEPDIAWLRERLEQAGLTPFPLPIAVHQGGGGHCQKGSPCDGFPCKIRAKGDGENAFLRPALREIRRTSTEIELVTGAYVSRLEHDANGRHVTRICYEHGGTRRTTSPREGGVVVLAAGAANSAVLLLRSRSELHPTGLANSTGLVGRNFMAHNNTVLMAINPFRRNRTRFQKTLAVNDWYLDPALGNIQMRGKIQPQNLARSPRPLVRYLRHWIARHSFDFWVMSEDLPDAANRVEPIEMAPGATHAKPAIRLTRRMNNVGPHRELVRRFRAVLRRCGFWFILERAPEARTIQHQVGTIRFGEDPTAAVLNRWCRSHEVENLYVVDGSVFPSSAAVNPALTIAANALRVGEYLKNHLVLTRSWERN